MKDDWRDRDRCLGLMRRYIEVGSKLPSADEVRDDPEALTTAKLIVAELSEIRAKIDSFKVRMK